MDALKKSVSEGKTGRAKPGARLSAKSAAKKTTSSRSTKKTVRATKRKSA